MSIQTDQDVKKLKARVIELERLVRVMIVKIKTLERDTQRLRGKISTQTNQLADTTRQLTKK